MQSSVCPAELPQRFCVYPEFVPFSGQQNRSWFSARSGISFQNGSPPSRRFQNVCPVGDLCRGAVGMFRCEMLQVVLAIESCTALGGVFHLFVVSPTNDISWCSPFSLLPQPDPWLDLIFGATSKRHTNGRKRPVLSPIPKVQNLQAAPGCEKVDGVSCSLPDPEPESAWTPGTAGLPSTAPCSALFPVPRPAALPDLGHGLVSLISLSPPSLPPSSGALLC